MNDLPELPLSEIQRPVVSGYNEQCCRHLILTVVQDQQARDFIRMLHDKKMVTLASEEHARSASNVRRLNIGFTYSGLCALDLPESLLRVFGERSPAFTEGAYLRAARFLADTGPSSTDHWEAPFAPVSAHVLLTLHADELADLVTWTKQLRAGTTGTEEGWGMKGWDTPIDGCHLPKSKEGHRRVHFDFIDGISPIKIKGTSRATSGAAASREFAAGEFLLGTADEEGVNSWLLAGSPPEVGKFFHCGSFAVFRKLDQDEKTFRNFVSRQAHALGVDKAYVMAKMLGRWADGQVVSPDSPASPGPAPTDRGLDDFDFTADRLGTGCPFGSHIRRMNPRGDPVVPFGKRPLIRRGMPFGPPYESGSPEAKRGLLGLFLCASIERQFEHLVAEWGDKNPMGTSVQGTAKDPLVGNHDAGGACFHIPVADKPGQQLTGFRPFVTTRGTLYLFVPSLTALATIGRSRSRADPNGEMCPICAQPLSTRGHVAEPVER